MRSARTNPSVLRVALSAALVALLLSVIGSVAVAQEDALLERYERAVANLESSVASLEDDPAQARDDLDRAFNTLVTLAGTTENAPLISAMERVFERARVALGNGSTVDLAVQTAVLEGGFQRVVLDAALVAARDGDLDLARQRTLAVATDAGLEDVTLERISSAGDARSLRLIVESSAATRVAALVRSTAEQLGTDLDGAYATFGEAYGVFLFVQDSPRIGAAANTTFTEAAQAIVDEDIEAATDALTSLNDAFVALAEAASAALEGRPATPPAPEGDVASDATDVSTDATSDEASPASAATVETGDSAEEPTETEEGAVEADADASDATDEAPSQALIEAAAEAAAAERRAEALAAVAADLTFAGLDAEAADALASTVVDAGYDDYDDVLGALRAVTADLVVAVRRADVAAQAAAFDAFDERFASLVAPALGAFDAALVEQTETLVTDLRQAPGLRLQDAAVLANHAAILDEAFDGVPPPAVHRAEVQTVGFWTGWVRLVFLLVFGLLTFVPLFLVNLAFGGGNRNWQLIGAGLFLLMLPVLYEAVAYLGTLAAELAGVEALRSIATFSLFHSVLTQVVWAAVTAVAIVLAIVGLYGICVQFGLLGASRNVSATQTGTATAEDTLVDWDDEF